MSLPVKDSGAVRVFPLSVDEEGWLMVVSLGARNETAGLTSGEAPE